MIFNKKNKFEMIIIALLLSGQNRTCLAEEEQNVFIPPIQQKKAYIEISHSNDWLNKDYKNWQSNNINLFIPQKEKGTTNIEFSQVNRYGMKDETAYINYTYPTKFGAANIELAMTSNPDFLYKSLYGLGWNGVIANGFGYITSYRQRKYNDVLSDMFSVTIEKYFSDYRLAYTNTQSTLDKDQREESHRVQLQWIAESNNRLGISYSSGNEPIDLGFHQLSSTNINHLQLDGVYWIKDFGISAAVWHIKQGEFYTRNGAQIGIRMAF